MADPFSILAGTAGLADVCFRVTKFLKQAKEGFQTVDKELEDLAEEIVSLRSVNDLIERSYTEGFKTNTDPEYQQVLGSHWRSTHNILASCQRIIQQLEALLKEILNVGSGKHVKLDQLQKWLKQQSREDAFNTLRDKLKAHQIALQTSLTAINIIYSRASQAISYRSHSDLSKSIQDLGADLEAKINSLKGAIHLSSEGTLQTAVESAQRVVPLASLNRHFYTPQTVSSIFIGREHELGVLKQHVTALRQSEGFKAQKRFVVYGLPGSGKTQFCCKFASDNKHSFWGVFWIDASSREHANLSFSTISTIGKVASNPAAVKSWLSSLTPDQPWLLIIDNADERDFPVEECFPDGNVGTILITTRNPMLRTYGTVGPQFYRFDELEEKESVELLLNAANESVPWIPSSVSSARNIAKTLGYLPLALIHAGRTILARLCTLETYLDVFNKNWARVRRLKDANAGTSISDINATIYSSYELIHDSILSKDTQASEDALDLLKIFSFLHRQRIRLDIFLRAATNPKVERLEQERKEHEAKASNIKSRPKLTWAQTLKSLVIRLHALLSNLGDRPVLPQFLLGTAVPSSFDEMRLRQGLKELFQMSLISTSSDPGDCYSVHPAVHLWVRERPEMTLMEQAVWCQMTANILSRAILLPPLGDEEEDEILRRDLLPHVRHVQQIEHAIQATFAMNQALRRKPWPILQPRLDRNRAIQLVKFSIIYAQGDMLKEAEKLQTYVANFVIRNLGTENTAAMDIMLLLSITYWKLTRVDKATSLQKQALDAATKLLGKEDPKTLKIMDAYGTSLWSQGRIPEARRLHEHVVEAYKKLHGNGHADTLRAMGNLGRAIGKDFDFNKAINIHREAFTGLKGQFGRSQLDTLIAMDNLAMAYFDRAAYRHGQPGDLDRALELEAEVFTTRTEKLGKEHLYTLWSGLNLARIRAVRGEIDKALSVFLPGHAISRRNLGESHFGYLLGELHYGRILMCAKRYREAETTLLGVVHAHEEHRRYHPDRLLAMLSLIKCRNVLGKEDETAVFLEELTAGTKMLFGPDHVAVQYLLDPQTLSKETSDVVLEAK